MLRELRLKNFAVVESVAVTFAPGLNVLTGETGAGKSILIDAIVLVRGGRAQSDVIRTEAETATVEAGFVLGGAPAGRTRRGGGPRAGGPFAGRAPARAARGVREEAGLAAEDDEMVVRRELARSGRH